VAEHSPAFIPPGAVGPAEARALAERALACRREDAAVLKLTGTGRVACLQGLVTCDVVKPGDGSHLFGALLTSKGMIVAPLWISRLADAIWIELPADVAPAVREVFARSLPPRLCRCEDLTPTSAAVGVYGPRAAAALSRVLGVTPPAGAAAVPYASGVAIVARSVARGLDGWDVLLPVALVRVFTDDLASSGTEPGTSALLETARILAGIPRLGLEIDERTLPQEVRFEELGAISYTKGCYLGQETVARIHFRGHPNRRMVTLALEAAPAAPPIELMRGERSAGRLTSAAWSERDRRWIALAVVRRDIAAGTELTLQGGGGASVLGEAAPGEA